MSQLDTYSASDRIAFVRSTVHLIGLACEAHVIDALVLVTAELQQIEALVEKLERPEPPAPTPIEKASKKAQAAFVAKLDKIHTKPARKAVAK